ncbi:hypothetical protein BU16DRAFT_561731 [Lophium mytilinum]|uniref:Uncharacterized protein n=1 Tax=Lophium mytilinum TaxID=390894 RepID=A0A6A6QSF8_9PEZI|nr:hypothetical protein BU16DRAFT_561731 [Lophium mytilinum]
MEIVVEKLFEGPRKTKPRFRHGKRDLCNLRLVIRETNHKTLREFGRRIFNGKDVDWKYGPRPLSLSEQTLKRFEKSSAHPVFGPAVRQLNFRLNVFEKRYAETLQGENTIPSSAFQPVLSDFHHLNSDETHELMYGAVSVLQNCRTVKIDFSDEYRFGKIDAQTAFNWKTWATDIYTMTNVVAMILHPLQHKQTLLEHLSVGENGANWWTSRGMSIGLLYSKIFKKYPHRFSTMKTLELALCFTHHPVYSFQMDEIFRSAGSTLEHLALRLDLSAGSLNLLHRLAVGPISQHLSVLKLTNFWARDIDLINLLTVHAATLKDVALNRIILGSGGHWATILHIINTGPFHLRSLECTALIQLERQNGPICYYLGVVFVGHQDVFDIDIADFSKTNHHPDAQHARYLGKDLLADKTLNKGDWVVVEVQEDTRGFKIGTDYQDIHAELERLIQSIQLHPVRSPHFGEGHPGYCKKAYLPYIYHTIM